MKAKYKIIKLEEYSDQVNKSGNNVKVPNFSKIAIEEISTGSKVLYIPNYVQAGERFSKLLVKLLNENETLKHKLL